ncbi:N-acyl-aromatic-L-amino acid amidohydrolase (carboxylate-forming) B-like [Trichomycterus rosablanca]|uniref:N-acyl-aromatic-L-amino acid amidohydrolase (carboxylate-forming) B-like n=1 Tax=Trichomycterus rosablanca TaxID=2290929 RepID=UPI002F358E7C
MELITFPVLRRVAVCGGTHGNELSGVYVVQELERQMKERGEAFPFSLTAVLSNPRAVEACKRYVDKDLNRCFTSAILSTPIGEDTPYEIRRAQELNSLLGPKGAASATDVLCDLHNTTAHMGLTIISYFWKNWICLHLYKYIQTKVTAVPVRLMLLDIQYDDAYSMESLSKNGITIEVGPQPHSVVRADIYNVMKQGVDSVLDWVKLFNSGKLIEGGEVDGYMIERSMDYPRDPKTQKPSAMIHPQLQDRDFQLLRRGDPVFLTFSGETLTYEDEEPLHAIFVNEAAYYEKGVAFHLARKKTVMVPSVRAEPN